MRRSGMLLRAAAQASGTPSTTLSSPVPSARISVFLSGSKFCERV